MNQLASTRLATVRRALLSASAFHGSRSARRPSAGVAAVARSRRRMPAALVAPALTAAVRELFVRPVRTMTGTDPKEHT
jgi:hypothetical protein